MQVLVTGGTGLIGSALTRRLRDRGDDVVIASRSRTGSGFIRWDPQQPASLRIPGGTDAVVHLAGAPVFGRRWTEDYRREIRRSRVLGTRTVVQAITDYEEPLKGFVSSSAVGFYGDRGDETLTEDASAGDDFLAGVCREWEREARALEDEHDAGVPTAVVRTGVVLAREGGALNRMLNPFPGVWPFHMGLGGPIGRGRQFVPWIHIADEVGALLHLLDHGLSGTFNLSAPNPVRNRELTRTIGDVLNRPAALPIPPFALRLLYGQAAEILTASQRVVPRKLREETDYEFRHPTLEDALEDLLV